MKMKSFLSIPLMFTLFVIYPICCPAQDVADFALAKTYFEEFDSLCAVDNGKLWGINLSGPTMFVVPESRIIMANQADNEGMLKEENGVFTGKLDENINIANSAISWGGKNWAIIMWSALSHNDPYARNKLIIHESWHTRVENEVGIVPVMTNNFHLDELQGSILIKLELRALSQALVTENDTDKKAALADAIIIRKYRQYLFPENNEDAFERHEGMPEYTGYKLCGLLEKVIPLALAQQLGMGENNEGFANSFAYLTGPAYGVVLDQIKIKWLQKIIEGECLTQISEYILDIDFPSDSSHFRARFEATGPRYDYENLVKSETAKFDAQKELIESYTGKFLLGSKLIIRNNNLNFSFNPQEKLTSIENGVVYLTMRLVGDWGILEVTNGIYRSNDWQIFIVSAPGLITPGLIKEDDYELTLNDGWGVVEIGEGKYTLAQIK